MTLDKFVQLIAWLAEKSGRSFEEEWNYVLLRGLLTTPALITVPGVLEIALAKPAAFRILEIRLANSTKSILIEGNTVVVALTTEAKKSDLVTNIRRAIEAKTAGAPWTLYGDAYHGPRENQ